MSYEAEILLQQLLDAYGTQISAVHIPPDADPERYINATLAGRTEHVCIVINRCRNYLERFRVPDSIKYTGEGDLNPTPHDGDVGFDLSYHGTEPMLVPVGEFVDVPCGVSVEFPKGTWGRIVGRSSTFRKYRLLVIEGVIDEGYRGPLFVGVANLGHRDFYVQPHDRLGQLIPQRNHTRGMKIEKVGELAASSRGSDGFGSTDAR